MSATPPPINHDTQRQHADITARMAKIGLVMPGTLAPRHTRCSSPGCHCHTDDEAKHGPYWSWTRKIAGKTTGHTITPNDVERYTPWFNNARTLRSLVNDLEALTLTHAQAHGWGEK